jgi:hypothetical protein
MIYMSSGINWNWYLRLASIAGDTCVIDYEWRVHRSQDQPAGILGNYHIVEQPGTGPDNRMAIAVDITVGQDRKRYKLQDPIPRWSIPTPDNRAPLAVRQ